MRFLKGCLFFAVCLPAATPTFEVASIKAHQPDGGPLRVSTAVEAAGIHFTNVTVKACIREAYGLKPYQISGGPGWMSDDRYDILAKAAGPSSRDQLMLMLQSLLAERFHLTFHRESKEMPVYLLVPGNKGAKIHAVKDDDRGTEIGGDSTNALSFRNISMAGLAASLARLREVDRPVVNRTGLEGVFTFHLELASDDTGPSIFTAVQEQLGLKLEPGRGSVDILVIDRVERPSEN